MKKIDHVKKMVYIIVGILTIISLVFTIYKKISHAAGGASTVSGFPLQYGNGFGGVDPTTVKNFMDNNGGWQRPLDSPRLITMYEYTDETHYVLDCYSTSANNFGRAVIGNEPQFNLSERISLGYFGYRIRVTVNGDNISAQYGGQGYDVYLNLNNVLETDHSGFLVYKSGVYLNYPLWCQNYSLNFADSGNPAFAENSGGGISGHSKGGVLTNYIDSEDLLENSSDLPKVDTTPPADPSSNAGWFQKILNGIGRLNQSVQGGVLTIGDYIGAGIEKLQEKLSEIKDSITGLYDWFTEDFDKNQFQNGINSIPLISDLNGLITLIENCGMFDWSDVSPAQSVSFTFDFGGAVLPHSSNTIDFSWYTGNVKTLCNAILCTFLVLGLLVTVVNQVPSIIGGHSGDKGGGSDS